MNHFLKNGQLKKSYDNFTDAHRQACKFNSNIDNVGKRKAEAYKCKICNSFHVGTRNKKITFDLYYKLKEKAEVTVIIKK